jgi:hypothetical protein
MEKQNEQIQVEIQFPAESGKFRVTRIGPNLYRFEDLPIFLEEVNYYDVFEAEAEADGRLQFKRVVEESKFQVFCSAVSSALIQTPEFALLLDKVEKLGGYGDAGFGGLICICLPPDSEIELGNEIDVLITKLKSANAEKEAKD